MSKTKKATFFFLIKKKKQFFKKYFRQTKTRNPVLMYTGQEAQNTSLKKRVLKTFQNILFSLCLLFAIHPEVKTNRMPNFSDTAKTFKPKKNMLASK